MKKIISIILFIFVFIFSLNFLNNLRLSKSQIINPVLSSDSVHKTASVSRPESIIIPKLNIEAEVESVGKDTEGRMDVPKNVYNTAWYNLGKKPGEIGNAVIAGHINTPEFTPSVFAKLGELETNDLIIIKDQNNNFWNFKVANIKEFDSGSFPIPLVFGPSNLKFLNLITCSGNWNSKNQEYDRRLVVFSQLI